MGPGGTLDASLVTVMGPPSIRDAQLAGWFASRAPAGYRATVPPLELARLFLQEGFAERVRGDVAFCQSVLETGWMTFPDSGQVRPEDNNFGGLGATDGGAGRNVARFPDARSGVRAQVQHLRRYADPTCATAAALHHPLVDPRFSLVNPPGKAPLWSQFGHGIWASSTNDYGGRILGLYAGALAWRDAHP